MSIQFTWHGHATWQMQTPDYSLVVDPFFDANPSCSTKASSVACQFILLTHGHFDHVADVVAIAQRTNAQVVANYEIATWLQNQGVSSAFGMNLGGTAKFPFGRVKMTPAWHSSTLPDGTNGGTAAGLIISISGKNIYFAGDTALFSDMSLIGNHGIDVAVVPIGDLYTMGIDDSVEALKLIRPKLAFPSHYGTWPPIAQDANFWAETVGQHTSAKPIVLQAGESFEVD